MTPSALTSLGHDFASFDSQPLSLKDCLDISNIAFTYERTDRAIEWLKEADKLFTTKVLDKYHLYLYHMKSAHLSSCFDGKEKETISFCMF